MAERCASRQEAESRARAYLAQHPKPAVAEVLPRDLAAASEDMQYWAVTSDEDLDTVPGLVIGLTVMS